MTRLLTRLLDVDRREARTVGLLWAQSFFIGLAIVSYETAATALFLGSFDVSSLPQVYIWASAVGVVFGFAYLHLEKRLDPGPLFQATVILILAGLLGVRLLLAVSDAKGAYLAAMIWVDITIIFLSLQFWSQAGLLLTVRQGKRLFGVIGSGECAGIVFGGLILPLLVRVAGTLNLIVWSAICTGICLFLLRRTATEIKGSGHEDDTDEDEGFIPVREMLGTPYFRLLFGHALLLVLTGYFVDFLFYSVAEKRFEDEKTLASFLGPFFAMVGVLAFLTKLFAFNRIMRRFGVLGGLLAVPLAVTFAISAALLAAHLFPSAGIGGFTWVFGFVAMAKLLDIGLRTGISEPTNALLFLPIPAAQRVRVQSFSNSVAEPLFRGLAGFLLLLISVSLGWASLQVAWAVFVLFVLLIGYCFAVRRGYAAKLLDTFCRRKLPAEVTMAGLDLESLRQYLQSDEPGEVIYVLRLIASQEDATPVEEDLLRALGNPSLGVRLEAVKLLERHGTPRTLARLEPILKEGTDDPPMLAAVVRTYCHLRGQEAVAVIAPLLDHPDETVVRAALTGLVKQGEPGGLRALNERAGATDPLLRCEAARILADVGDASLEHGLVALLRDSAPRVRRAAVQAARNRGGRDLAPDLVNLLGDPELESEARQALANLGPEAVPELIQRFEKLPEQAPARLAVVKTLSLIRNMDAMAFMDRLLDAAETDLRDVLVRGLANLRFRPGPERRAAFVAMVERDLELMNQNRTDESLCSELPLVRRTLAAEQVAGIHRIFDFLRLLDQPDAALLTARTRFLLGDEHQRALALELLDNVLEGDLRIKTLAAFEKLRRDPPPGGNPEGAMSRVLERPSRDTSAFLKAAIIWTIWRRDRNGLPRALGRANMNGAPILEETVAFCTRSDFPIPANDLLISKTELLSGVSLFDETPVADLVELARLLHPRPVATGELLIAEGDRGTGMFVLMEGRIRVHKGDRELAAPGAGSVIGELAALDPEPRAASVTVLSAGVVLELSGDQLRAFMASRPAVAQGVFRFLCSRIRRTTGAETAMPRMDPGHESFESREGTAEEGFPLFEKCRALAGVSIFRDVPDSVLAEVGRRVIVKFARKNQIVIQHGEVGESLFILVQGGARVHHGEHTLALLEKGAVFGELAALSPEPRTASVTATEESTLFQISGRLLYDLIGESPELVASITRVLCGQLRDRLRQLEEEKSDNPAPGVS